jgi:hypothetical protein
MTSTGLSPTFLGGVWITRLCVRRPLLRTTILMRPGRAEMFCGWIRYSSSEMRMIGRSTRTRWLSPQPATAFAMAARHALQSLATARVGPAGLGWERDIAEGIVPYDLRRPWPAAF